MQKEKRKREQYQQGFLGDNSVDIVRWKGLSLDNNVLQLLPKITWTMASKSSTQKLFFRGG